VSEDEEEDEDGNERKGPDTMPAGQAIGKNPGQPCRDLEKVIEMVHNTSTMFMKSRMDGALFMLTDGGGEDGQSGSHV